MKSKYYRYTVIIAISLSLITTFCSAQTFNFYIANDYLVSPTVFEFDVYIQNTSGVLFKFRNTNQCFTFNPAFINGAAITPSLVSTSLNNYVVSTFLWSAASSGFHAIQNASALACSNGTNIPSSGTPVKIATFRLTATTGFFGCAPSNPNMAVSGDVNPTDLFIRMSVSKWNDVLCAISNASTITGPATQYTRFPSQTQYNNVNNNYTTDNNICTTDACNPANGIITHTPVNTDDGDPASVDGCDLATGVFHNFKIYPAIPFETAVRDNAGNPIANQTISLRFSIRDAATNGTILYQEKQVLPTDNLGMFNARIGLGIPVIGTFESINWSVSVKFIQVELDAAGGNFFTDLGSQSLLSVPYTLSAVNGRFNKSGNDIYNNNSGNVGIGLSTPSQKLQVAGNGLFTGTITASCGVLVCSDIRYKNSIYPLKNSLDNLCKINGVSYYFKKDEFYEMNFSREKQIGIIAQELEIIYPELVYTGSDGYKSVDYSKLTPILIEAVKELKNETDLLKADDAQLMNDISKIKAQLFN